MIGGQGAGEDGAAVSAIRLQHGPGLADHRDALPSSRLEGDALERPASPLVRETHVLCRHIAAHPPELDRIVRSEAFRQKLGDLGVQPATAPLTLPEFQKAEIVKWGKAVRDSGAQQD